MRILGWTIARARRVPDGTTRVEYGRRLTEREVREALNVPLENPVLRACLQLLADHEQQANENAANDVHLGSEVTAMHIGGGKYLRAQRDMILHYVPAGKPEDVG